MLDIDLVCGNTIVERLDIAGGDPMVVYRGPTVSRGAILEICERTEGICPLVRSGPRMVPRVVLVLDIATGDILHASGGGRTMADVGRGGGGSMVHLRFSRVIRGAMMGAGAGTVLRFFCIMKRFNFR